MIECPKCHVLLPNDAPLGVCPACLLEGATRREVLREEIDLGFLEESSRCDVLGVFDGYEVLEVVGQGASGIVLKAEDAALRRTVAIKVLHPVLATSAVSRERFIREARAAAALRNDHVVTIHAVSEWKELPYFVMEYVAGKSLAERIREEGPLAVREVLRIGQQMANGLAAAHAQGLVHRDIKPGNVLLENGVERVKLTDFGLARAHDETGLTVTGFVSGTPEYMAPEQVAGKKVDGRADLYALGAVVYAMAAGEAPHQADSAAGILHKVANHTPERLAKRNGDVPRWLDRIVQRLMAKRPEDRMQSAEEAERTFRERLAEVQRTGQGGGGKRRGGRKMTARRLMPLAAVVLLALLGTGAWVIWSGFFSGAGSETRGPGPKGSQLNDSDEELFRSMVQYVRENGVLEGVGNPPPVEDLSASGQRVVWIGWEPHGEGNEEVLRDLVGYARENGFAEAADARFIVFFVVPGPGRSGDGSGGHLVDVRAETIRESPQPPPQGAWVGAMVGNEAMAILEKAGCGEGMVIWAVAPSEDDSKDQPPMDPPHAPDLKAHAALTKRLDRVDPEWGLQGTTTAPDLKDALELGAAVRFLSFRAAPPSGLPVPSGKTLIEEAREEGLPAPEKASFVILVMAERGSARAREAAENLLARLNRENPPGGGWVGRLILDEAQEVLPAGRRVEGSEVWLVYPPEIEVED